MPTLRSKYHDLGNKIHMALLGVGEIKERLGMFLNKEADEGTLKESVCVCERIESSLLEIDRELAAIKTITYRLGNPDKRMEDYLEEIRTENQQIKILIVDDDRELCEILKKTYERRGFPVFIAVDGEEAWRVVQEQKPRIILLDFYLSGNKTSGGLIRSIKAELPATKCLVITREDDESRLAAIRQFEPDEILIKPLMAHQLDVKISALISAMRK